MTKKRALIQNDIIHYKYVLLTTLTYIAYISYLIIVLTTIFPICISLPLAIFMILPMWQMISFMILNIEIVFSKEITEYNCDCEISEDYPDVAFVIPSYQEPFEVAKMTFDSVYNMRYKGRKEIIVVDNSKDKSALDYRKWEEYVTSFRSNAKEIVVKFVYNNKAGGLKPGNLDLAEEHIEDSEYVVFLDVDSTFPYDEKVIEESISEFRKDRSLGWIQYLTKSTNHHFNECSQAIGIFQNLLRITCFFRSLGGFVLFYGHNAMWKRSCLTQLGPWLERHRGQVIVTEDFLKCTLAYSKGYYGKSIPVETGEWVPSSLKALESMWQRWTYGTCQVMGKYFYKLIETKRMTLLEKYDFLHSVLLYLAHALSLPLAILYIILLPPTVLWKFVAVLCILPPVLGGIAIYRHHIKYLPSNVFGHLSHFYASTFMISPFVTCAQLKGIVSYLLRIPQGWKVTTKGPENADDYLTIFRQYNLYLALAAVMVFCSMFSWYVNFGTDVTGLVYYIPTIFMSVNLFLTIIIYGKSGRIQQNSIHASTIDSINNKEKEHLVIGQEMERLREAPATYAQKELCCSMEVPLERCDVIEKDRLPA